MEASNLVTSMQGLSLQPALQNNQQIQERAELRRIRVIPNVHQDDIHSLIKLSDQTFVTGSKDGSLKKWDFNGKLIKVLDDSKRIDYKKWVTALTPLDDKQWISGYRDGTVLLWDTSGKYIKNLEAEPHFSSYDSTHKCKERNQNRVNCLASFVHLTQKPFFFVGWPTQFTLHNSDQSHRLNYTYTNGNDWVYVVEPVTKTSLLVVTGCRLDLWKKNETNSGWHRDVSVIQENKGTQPRPYISALTPLKNTPGQYGVAVFDGSVRVVDLEKRKTTFHGTEHKNRVWTIENTNPACFASCADDGYIKLWDIRIPPKSTFTIRDNEKEKARVSVLLQLDNNQLVSGSCPDDVRNTHNKAQFSFWDIRRLA